MSWGRATRWTGLLAAGAGVAVAAGGARAWRGWERADDPTGGAPLELPAGRELTVTSADGARLAVWDMGDPEEVPVVLGHGWTADRRVWASVARRLTAAGRRPVVFDQRGHGASEAGTDGLTLPALAGDLAALLDALDAPRAVLVGHSLGGMAALAFAIDQPAVCERRVSHLVLVATAARSPLLGRPGGLAERVATAAVSSGLSERGLASERLGPWLVRASLGRSPSMVALRATQESVVAAARATRRDLLAEIASLDLVDALPGVRVPTTVAYGTADLLTPPKLNRELVESIPGAVGVVLHGCGHQLPFEAPDQLADVVLDVLERQAGPESP